MAPVDPDCKAPASGAGVNSGLSHSRRCRCPPLQLPTPHRRPAPPPDAGLSARAADGIAAGDGAVAIAPRQASTSSNITGKLTRGHKDFADESRASRSRAHGRGRLGSASTSAAARWWRGTATPRRASHRRKRGLRVVNGPRAVADEAEVVLSIITEDKGVRQIFTAPGWIPVGRGQGQALRRDEHAAADDAS